MPLLPATHCGSDALSIYHHPYTGDNVVLTNWNINTNPSISP